MDNFYIVMLISTVKICRACCEKKTILLILVSVDKKQFKRKNVAQAYLVQISPFCCYYTVGVLLPKKAWGSGHGYVQGTTHSCLQTLQKIKIQLTLTAESLSATLTSRLCSVQRFLKCEHCTLCTVSALYIVHKIQRRMFTKIVMLQTRGLFILRNFFNFSFILRNFFNFTSYIYTFITD